MRYYKLVNGKNIIGVATQENFRRIKEENSILLVCDVDSAQYIEHDGTYYRDDWMRDPSLDYISYVKVQIIPIEEEEYSTLSEVFRIKEQVPIIEEVEPVNKEVVDIDEDTTLEFVREIKLQEIDNKCTEAIAMGSNVILSDGNEHHFSFTYHDQINVAEFLQRLSNGAESVLWHADGEPLSYFTRDDIAKIYETMIQVKDTQLTYAFKLKAYVKSLEDIDEIIEIYYGQEIPAVFM